MFSAHQRMRTVTNYFLGNFSVAFFYGEKSSRTPCPLLGGDRVASDLNGLKPHGGLSDVSQKRPEFCCETLPEHFLVFSLVVVKGRCPFLDLGR